MTFKEGHGLAKEFKLPFRVTRTPFPGIRELHSYKNGQATEILAERDKVQIILVMDHHQLQLHQQTIQWFAEVVAKNKECARLHIILVSSARSHILDHIELAQYENTHTYITSPSNPYAKFALLADKNVLVVDTTGRLVGLRTVYHPDHIEQLIRDPGAYDRGVPETFVLRLRELPNEPIFLELTFTLNSLPYPPQVELSYLA